MKNKRIIAVLLIMAIGAVAAASLASTARLRAKGQEETAVYLPVIRRLFQPQLEPYVTNIVPPAVVTDIVDPGDGRLFIATRDGRIQIIDQGGDLLPDLLLDIRNKVYDDGNEMGLVGLAAHPDYADNGTLFVFYTEEENDLFYAVLARYTAAAGGVADADGEERILQIEVPTERHHGGALQFGPLDGYLYVAIGDGGTGLDFVGNAQSKETLMGKILRIDVDSAFPYAIPADNPFAAESGSRGEIWALGLRNPWRISFDSATGDMFLGDVGESTWEEINFIPAGSGGGANFGWPCMEGPEVFRENACADAVDYVAPIFAYAHKNNCGSVVGGYVYRGAGMPDFFGDYFFADLCAGNIWSMRSADGLNWAVRDWGPAGINITTFGERIDGELFLGAVFNRRIYQFVAQGQ